MATKQLKPIKNQGNIRAKSKSIAERVVNPSDVTDRQSPRNFNPNTTRERQSLSVFTKRKYSQVNNTSENAILSKRGIDDIVKDQDINYESQEGLINLKIQTPRY